jgi:hypothetical protein
MDLIGEFVTRLMLHGDGASPLVPLERLHSVGFARFVDASRELCTHFHYSQHAHDGAGSDQITSLR